MTSYYLYEANSHYACVLLRISLAEKKRMKREHIRSCDAHSWRILSAVLFDRPSHAAVHEAADDDHPQDEQMIHLRPHRQCQDILSEHDPGRRLLPRDRGHAGAAGAADLVVGLARAPFDGVRPPAAAAAPFLALCRVNHGLASSPSSKYRRASHLLNTPKPFLWILMSVLPSRSMKKTSRPPRQP